MLYFVSVSSACFPCYISHSNNPDKSFVFTDARFINELDTIKNIGGKIIRVKRGDEPTWFDIAKNQSNEMKNLYPNVHISEYDWVKAKN